MKTFTAAMTASELKIKGELALDRLKAKMLNSLYDQVASNEKSSGAPRDS